MRSTRNDVAKLAGVSSATVSHVINSTKPVSAELKEKVENAILRLHYLPNRLARSMKTNKSMQVGFILSNIENPIYADILKSFEQEADNAGYSVNLFTGYENQEKYFHKAIMNGLDGVLIEPLPNQFSPGFLSRLQENDIRIVLLSNTTIARDHFSLLRNDYTSGIRQGLVHLKSLGHQKIAYLDGLAPSIGNEEMRCAAFNRLCHEMNLAHLVLQSPQETQMTLEAGRDLGPLVHSRLSEFTAVICTNDLLAIGMMTYLKQQGVRLPAELSVIGIDDNIYCPFFEPALTSVRADYRELGKLGFSCLLQDILHDETSDILMPMDLVVRDTTAIPRRAE